MSIARLARIASLTGAAGALVLAGLGTAAQAESSDPGHWSYSGDTGPSHWGSLSPDFATCADGTAQSPINIKKTKEAKLKNLVFSYHTGEAEVFNNGHTVEVEPVHGADNTVRIGKVSYPFAQFHFHAPSEHTFNGQKYPLEIHFVHKTADGNAAVVAVFVKEGKRNPEWAKFVNVIPVATADPAATTIADLDWAKLLPTAPQTIRYEGSLTTPACSQGVKWNLMTTPIEMSRNQIAAFTAAYTGNVRPVQPLNGRLPLLDVSAR